MVLLTLFAGDGGYNPQLQRVGEGETFLHGYLTIHVIINPTHNRCNFHFLIKPTWIICQKSQTLFTLWLFRWRPPETSPTWRAGSAACMTRRYLSTSIPYWLSSKVKREGTCYYKPFLRTWPTLLWTCDLGTRGLRRPRWSTTTSTQCGTRSSGSRWVLAPLICASNNSLPDRKN